MARGHRRQDRQGGDDTGDRNVAVEVAPLVGLEHLGVEQALDTDDRQSCFGGGALDGVKASTRPLDHEECGCVGLWRELGHRDDRVKAATEGDQDPTRVSGDPCARARPIAPDDGQPGQVEVIAQGELAESGDVEATEELALGRGGLDRAEVDGQRRGGLEVRDAGEEAPELSRSRHTRQ